MSYSLQTSYMGESLLSGFDWFNGEDLSNGFVSYQSREDAEAMNLFSVDEQSQVVRLGVDSNNTVGLDEGRPSIRIESKESYDHGLFIADFLHMPPSQCGLWPAFWMYGTDWPHGGELDIIEGANTYHRNIISAHTADGCQQDDEVLFTGEQRNTDCAIGSQNIGCGFNPPANDTTSYGDSFNAVGGGVYAVEWNSEHMKVWHFSRGAIPSDIEEKKPEPSGWGVPQAVFGGSKCDVDSFFKNMSIVININFCGDYGDATWGQSETCSSIAPTCSDYVANNPEAFANAHWDIKYIDAYQMKADNVKAQFITPSATPSSVAAAAASPVVASPAAASPAAASPAAAAPAAVAPEALPAAPRNPHTIDTFANLGCFASDSDFSNFDVVEETEQMTLDRCVQSCSAAGHSHAGVFDLQCLCADGLDVATTRAVADETRCSLPCPANGDQSCGGGDWDARLLSMYASIHKEMEAPLAAPMAGGPSTTTVTICPTPTAANRLIIEAPAATPGSNTTFIQPYFPGETPATAGSAGLLPDWKLGALSSVVVIGALMLL